MQRMVEKAKNQLLRPVRQIYSDQELPAIIVIGSGLWLERQDFDLFSSSGYKLCCSLYRNSIGEKRVVIFLHGNAGSRVQSLPLAQKLGSAGFSLLTFDFAGCGRSQGEGVTMGLREQQDIGIVVKHAVQQLGFGQIYLWGRSMGSVTALLYLSRETSLEIVAAVADSPYSDIPTLIKEYAGKVTNLPSLLVKPFIAYLLYSIKNSDGVDLQLANPLQAAAKIKVPVCLVAALEDQLISNDHSERIYQRLCCKKQLLKVEGGHNSNRSQETLQKCINFMLEARSLKRIEKQRLKRKAIRTQRGLTLSILSQRSIRSKSIQLLSQRSSESPVSYRVNNYVYRFKQEDRAKCNNYKLKLVMKHQQNSSPFPRKFGFGKGAVGSPVSSQRLTQCKILQ